MHECHRWNFDASDTALLVCRNEHDKGDKCDMQPMHPAEVLALVNDLRARLIEADARVAAEREPGAVIYRALVLATFAAPGVQTLGETRSAAVKMFGEAAVDAALARGRG